MFLKATIFQMICMVSHELVLAKSDPVIVRDPKIQFSQKLNSVSSTPKPENQFQPIQQYQTLQPQRQYPTQQSSVPQHLQYQPQMIIQQQKQLQQIPLLLHPQSQQQILQLIQRALYSAQQNQPTAMIIIAQPAVAHYANTMQQLLNYFHNNPQARYEFLQGNYRQHPVPQLTSQPPTAQTIGHYQMFPASPHYQQNFVTLPATIQPLTSMMLAQPLRNYPQPTSPSIPQSIHLTQAPAQQYSYPSQQNQNELENLENGQAREEIPIRSLPPIITGFENFTPEQQAKIKAQLAEHFGAPLKPLPTDSHSHQREQQNQGVSQVSSKYRYFSDSGNFKQYIPNEEVKNENLNVAKTTYSKM